MRSFAFVASLSFVVVTACARPSIERSERPPERTSERDPLEGCRTEREERATLWSCGDGFLAMEAEIDDLAKDAVDANVEAFLAPFRAEIVGRDDAPFSIGARTHRAVRVEIAASRDGGPAVPFVARLVVLPGPNEAAPAGFLLTCNARAAFDERCVEVLRRLGGRHR